MRFSIRGEIRGIEVIARGPAVRDRVRLRKLHGSGRWRKMKGIATIELTSGRRCVAEIHWYEAHGIGRKEFKVKKVLRRL